MTLTKKSRKNDGCNSNCKRNKTKFENENKNKNRPASSHSKAVKYTKLKKTIGAILFENPDRRFAQHDSALKVRFLMLASPLYIPQQGLPWKAFIGAFGDEAGLQLNKFHEGQVGWLKKEIRCLMLGFTGNISQPALKLEYDKSDIENIHS